MKVKIIEANLRSSLEDSINKFICNTIKPRGWVKDIKLSKATAMAYCYTALIIYEEGYKEEDLES